MLRRHVEVIKGSLVRFTRIALLGRRIVNKRTLILLAFLALFVSVLGAWIIEQCAERSVAEERSQIEKQNIIPFEHKSYSPINNPAISIWQSYKTTKAIERFNDSIFVATDGGLVEFGATGNLRHHYTILDGLPESDLLSLATFNSKLLGGLAILQDGRVSRVFKDTNSKLTNNWMTAFCAVGPRVFVGTYGGGVFELTASGELQPFLARSGSSCRES
jgi:hypothetical protein